MSLDDFIKDEESAGKSVRELLQDEWENADPSDDGIPVVLDESTHNADFDDLECLEEHCTLQDSEEDTMLVVNSAEDSSTVILTDTYTKAVDAV